MRLERHDCSLVPTCGGRYSEQARARLGARGELKVGASARHLSQSDIRKLARLDLEVTLADKGQASSESGQCTRRAKLTSTERSTVSLASHLH